MNAASRSLRDVLVENRVCAGPTWCGCKARCGDDGDIDGPGTCKGLALPPRKPLVEIILVPRSRA